MIINDNKYFKWNMNFIIFIIDFIEYIVLIYYYKLNMYFFIFIRIVKIVIKLKKSCRKLIKEYGNWRRSFLLLVLIKCL